jgi:hypothetical protein
VVKVSVLYPNRAETKFDPTCCIDNHIATSCSARSCVASEKALALSVNLTEPCPTSGCP